MIHTCEKAKKKRHGTHKKKKKMHWEPARADNQYSGDNRAKLVLNGHVQTTVDPLFIHLYSYNNYTVLQ